MGDWEYWLARSRMMLANDMGLLERIQIFLAETGIRSIDIYQPVRIEKQGLFIDKTIPGNTSRLPARPNRSIQAAEELTECTDQLAAKYGVVSIRKTDQATEYHFTYSPGFAYGMGDMLVYTGGSRPGVTDYNFVIEIGEGWHYAYSIT